MKELENKLAQQVDDRSSVSPTDNAQVDHLLKRHQREVSELNQQIDDAKQRQEAQLKHKLEAKKLAKERCAQMRAKCALCPHVLCPFFSFCFSGCTCLLCIGQ